MAWKGVITNSGSELLAQWTAGKTLTITRAAAGTGRVSEAAMLAQTALVSEKQTVSILSNKTTAQGQKLQLQVTPLATGYPLNQLGIWAKLDSGAARLIALFQTDTDAGVEIPSNGHTAPARQSCWTMPNAAERASAIWKCSLIS